MVKNKKADILHEQLIFLILNVVFFAVIILFIYFQGSSVHLAEEETAKQIALLIDASKPGAELELNLADFFEKAEEEGIDRVKSIEINNNENLVVVKASKDGFFDYSYFNDVDVEYNIAGDDLILIIK